MKPRLSTNIQEWAMAWGFRQVMKWFYPSKKQSLVTTTELAGLNRHLLYRLWEVFIWPRTWYKFWILLQPLSPLLAYLSSFSNILLINFNYQLIITNYGTVIDSGQVCPTSATDKLDAVQLVSTSHKSTSCHPVSPHSSSSHSSSSTSNSSAACSFCTNLTLVPELPHPGTSRISYNFQMYPTLLVNLSSN